MYLRTHAEPLPMSGLAFMAAELFAQPKTFLSQIAIMRAIAAGIRTAQMPAQIPIKDAENIVKNALIAQGKFEQTIVEMLKDVTNRFVIDQIGIAASDSQGIVRRDILPLTTALQNAKRAGAKTFPSREIKIKIPRLIDGIRRGYETLHELEDIKPFLIRNMPASLAAIGKVADSVGKLSEVVDEALNKAADAAAPWLLEIEKIIKLSLLGTALAVGYSIYSKRK